MSVLEEFTFKVLQNMHKRYTNTAANLCVVGYLAPTIA